MRRDTERRRLRGERGRGRDREEEETGQTEENRKRTQRRNQTTRKFVSFPSSILFCFLIPFFPVFFFLKLFQLIGGAGSLGGSSPLSLTPSLSPAHPLPSTLAEGQAQPQPPPCGFPEDDVHEVFVKRKKHPSFHPPWEPRAWTAGAGAWLHLAAPSSSLKSPRLLSLKYIYIYKFFLFLVLIYCLFGFLFLFLFFRFLWVFFGSKLCWPPQ